MALNQNLPHDRSVDNSIAVMREGYHFIQNRLDKYKTEVFEARILGEQAICMSGEEAARLFYDTNKFRRNGAVPKRVQKSTFGVDAVHTMDDEAHTHRKLLFTTLLAPERQKEIAGMIMEELLASIDNWQEKEKIILFEEVKVIYCRAVCRWAGVPLKKEEERERAEDFSAMVDAFGAIGPRHWKGRRARNRGNEWIKQVIEDVRNGKMDAKQGTALYEMAHYKELDGRQLNSLMAAIELINVLRPVTVISIFATFAALAIHDHPHVREKLKERDPEYLECFEQEVRRFYPFAPFLGARVKADFKWKDFYFKKNMLVILDVYGTNHDERIWDKPEVFNPDRFRDWDGNLFTFIPQGGGDPKKTHRCPGEGVVGEVIKSTVDFLVNKIDFDVPKQNLEFSYVRMPTLPESGFIMENIRRK
ncbi:cytochrome P450 [Radiobacillus deserti]|uniref:Cytochrome P450 n=1 Tax=Radiobacillus deserti TaxID=2594883 RepID=A0A516KC80_9BACI|nr:cytochrome P450 [Radiobacillus deserti]QDP39004.1 cytochrome P450 [Radiobacillus deserti]